MNKAFLPGLNTTLLLFSCLILVVDRLYGAIAFIMMLICAWTLLRDRSATTPLMTDEKRLLLGLCAFPLVVACGMLLQHNWQLDQFDHSSRFLLVLPIFFAIRRYGASTQMLYLGLILGAIGAGSFGLYQITALGQERATGYIHPIQFGNISLLLGLLALTYCIRPQVDKPLKRLFVSGSVVAFCFGLIGSVSSGTRGGWIALPLLLWLILRESISNKLIRFIIYSLFIAAALITYNNNHQVQHRVDRAVFEVTDYLSAEQKIDAAGSAGTRFEMWRAAAMMFASAPAIGVGMGQYQVEINKLIEEGRIDPSVGRYGHAHNDLLFLAAELGGLGVIGLLALYGLLLWFFLQQRQHDRQLAFAGIVLVLGFIDFGITQALFRYNITTLFFALYSAVLTGLLCHQRIQRTPCPQRNPARSS